MKTPIVNSSSSSSESSSSESEEEPRRPPPTAGSVPIRKAKHLRARPASSSSESESEYYTESEEEEEESAATGGPVQINHSDDLIQLRIAALDKQIRIQEEIQAHTERTVMDALQKDPRPFSRVDSKLYDYQIDVLKKIQQRYRVIDGTAAKADAFYLDILAQVKAIRQ